jgi:energy-coupling factor transport system ATP-binding protein
MRLLWSLEKAEAAFETAAGTRPALRRLDLQIAEGEFVAVVGRNGSGKSTLLRVLAGLSPLTGGTLRTAQDQANRPVRIVWQSPDAQIIGETVGEEIAFGMTAAGVPPAEVRERVRQALDAVGLPHGADWPVERLSGGQKQLLVVAAALAAEAKALLLDEPTALLDPVSGEAVRAAVAKAHRRGAAVVWATQQMDELGAADRVLALADGELAFDGTAERFFYGAAVGEGIEAQGKPAQNGGAGAYGEAGASGEFGGYGAGGAFGTAGAHEPTPCERLGFRPPYAVETVLHLIRMGLDVGSRPVASEQALKAVDALCR